MSKKEEFAPKPEEKGELKIEAPIETVERLSAEYRQGAEKKVEEVKVEAKEGVALVQKERGSEQQIAMAEKAGGKMASGTEKAGGRLKTSIELAMEKIATPVEKFFRGEMPAEALPAMTGGSGEVIREEEEAMAAERMIREREEKKIEVRKRAEEAKRERYGVEDFTKEKLFLNIGKGALNSIGSVFGFRLGWEAPKLIYDHFKKKGQKEKLNETTNSLLQEAQKGPKAKKGEKPVQEKVEAAEIGKGPVALKIKELNERLKEAKMSPEDKRGLRSEYAQILKEYRHQGKNLEEAKIEKTGKVLDLYINNSAQKMIVGREAVNTLSIMAMTPWLRLAGYTAFAGAERAVKAADSFEKKHFREKAGFKKEAGKLGFLAKNLTFDAAKETLGGLTWNFFNKGKEKKGAFQKSADVASSVFMLMRVVGLVEFEKALQSGSLPIQEGAKKFWESLESGNFANVLKQGTENWLTNSQRLLSYVGLAENPNQAIQKLVTGETPTVKPAGKSLLETMAEEKGREQERLGMEIAQKSRGEWEEKMKHAVELATIKKGEGIEHTFIRQIEDNPQVFGYKGDPNNVLDVHRFAQNRAHRFAEENGFFNSKTGEETRVLFDTKNPSAYILKSDGSVERLNPHEYTWKPHEETKEILEKAKEVKALGMEQPIPKLDQTQEIKDINKKIDELLAAGVSREDIMDSGLTGKDIQNLTPEQIKEIHQENLKEQMKSVNVPGEELKEALTKRVFVGGSSNEIINSIESYPGGSAERTIENTESGIRAVFHFNPDMEITNVSVTGGVPSLEVEKLFQDNWEEVVKNKIEESLQGKAMNSIEGAAVLIQKYKEVLKMMREMGTVDSGETMYLKDQIKGIVETMEMKYGDVFKELKIW